MKLALFSLVAIAAFSASAFAADYNVDASHSRVGFSVRHLMSKVRGEFKDFEGSFSFDEKKPDASKVKFTAKAASIYTNNDKRDEHLRGPDFFDVEKNPSLAFVGKKLTAAGKGKFKLEGDLTMRGVTKPVVFNVEYAGAAKDPWGNTRAGFSAETKVNRKDFGIVFNKTLDNGGLMLGDDVDVTLDVEGVQAQAPAKK